MSWINFLFFLSSICMPPSSCLIIIIIHSFEFFVWEFLQIIFNKGDMLFWFSVVFISAWGFVHLELVCSLRVFVVVVWISCLLSAWVFKMFNREIIHRNIEMLISSVCLVFGAKASVPSLLFVSLLLSVAWRRSLEQFLLALWVSELYRATGGSHASN